jgi:hypothetical protein
MTELDRGGQAANEESAEDAAWRLEDIATRLSATGLLTQLRDTADLIDLTAHVHKSGHRDAAAIIDPDGYVELRSWISTGTPAAQAADIIGRALTLITTTA